MASLSFGRTKLRLLSTFMIALGLVVQPFSMVMANTAYAASDYTSSTFSDWESSGGTVAGATAPELAGDSQYANVNGSVFTRWGGYENIFPTNGYTTSLDVYLDMAAADGSSSNHFEFSSAISNASGDHLRDFIFHVGVNPAYPNTWFASANNNANSSFPSHLASGSTEITQTGWYSMVSEFSNNGSGVLEVTMKLVDRDTGDIVGSWVLSTPTDAIPSVVGGHRYGWFVSQPFTNLHVDNASLVTNPEPACSAGSAFDGFALGSVNGQGGWSSTGSYDQRVVANLDAYGYPGNGCKSLRISNAVTSGSFGDQTFSPSVVNEAGETSATNGGMSTGTRQNHYEAEFSIGTTQSTQQLGLAMSVSPDRGDGSRMSYLSFADGVAGLDVTFYDVQGVGNPANFVATPVVSGLSRSTPHTVKFVIDFVDGPSNDVVKIYIDGVLKHTGTSWENYYRYDAEAAAEQSTRTVDSLLFRMAGTAVPANSGKGFLIDGTLAVTTSTPAPAPAPTPTPTGGSGGGSTSGTSTTTSSNAGRGGSYFGTGTYDDSWMIGANTGTDENSGTDGEVLSSGAAVSGTSTETDSDSAIVPNKGISWYWWLLIGVLAAGAWTLISMLRNGRFNNR